MSAGERIKIARKKAGMTQAELAAKSGLAAISIHQYEAGKRHPQLKQILHIADALGVDALELVPEEKQDEYQDLFSYIQYRKDLRDKIPIIPEWTVPPTTTAEYHRARIGYRFDVVLNDAGQEKAAEAVEIIAGNPDYQRESWKQSQKAPESTPPAREGTDTIPPSGGLQRPQEDEE